jgi:hypothetical protein
MRSKVKNRFKDALAGIKGEGLLEGRQGLFSSARGVQDNVHVVACRGIVGVIGIKGEGLLVGRQGFLLLPQPGICNPR